jgi:hypothetical protein
MDSHTRRSLQEILQQGAGSSGVLSRKLVMNSEPAAKVSAKGRDEPEVQNMPEARSGTSLTGASDTDTPLQAAINSGLPAAGGELEHPVPGTAGFHLAKNALSGCTRRKLKKAKPGPSESKTGGSSNQEMQLCPSRGKPQPKPLRGQGQRTVLQQKWLDLQKGPGNFKKALTNAKIAIFKEKYPADKLTE